MTTETRELKREEFYLAEKLWEQYRGQKADPDLYFGRILSRLSVPEGFLAWSRGFQEKPPENLTDDRRL